MVQLMLPSVLTVKNKPARIQEDARSGLQMTPQRFVGTSKGYLWVNGAIDHVAIHAHNVVRAGEVLHADVFRWEGSVAHNMIVVAA
jgi:hypothetical protein